MSRILLVLGLLFGFRAVALAPDAPTDGQTFSQFIRAITRGGLFQGVKLDAPPSFQKYFFQRIRRGVWVGELDRVRDGLVAHGQNLWGEWYTTQTPQSLLARNFPGGSEEFQQAMKSYWPADCESGSLSLTLPWSQWTRCQRRALMDVVLKGWKDQNQQSLLGVLASRFGLTAEQMENSVEVYLLSSAEFAAKVHEMGYEGEIYFRGITGPNPHQPDRLWILLNDDLMQQYSSFDRPLLKALEYAGITSHEMAHVAQELVGRQLKVSVDVESAEEALLIEGQAEYENEQAWIDFSARFSVAPFALFAREQAVEVVFREGNEQSGNLFPYTVGLPFYSAIAMEWGERQRLGVDLDREIAKVLGDQSTLQEWLFAKMEIFNARKF